MIFFSLLAPIEKKVFSLVKAKARAGDQHVFYCSWDLHARTEKAVTTGVGLGPVSTEPVIPVVATEELATTKDLLISNWLLWAVVHRGWGFKRLIKSGLKNFNKEGLDLASSQISCCQKSTTLFLT